MASEASAGIARLVLAHGRPVKDEDWVDGEWRDYDWDHAGADCGGWQETGMSEVVEWRYPLEGGILFVVTHCRCSCRVFPLVTIGLEGARG